MAKRRRRNHKPEFKAKVAVEAVKGLKTVSQIADEFELQSSQVTAWKSQLRKGAPSLFEQPSRKEETPEPSEDVAALQAKIGELTMELDWLKKKSKNWSL